tara:strand:+ start:271 stop:789 length:519 start_codon:yes stop_codon:yes gene_type:complete
MSAGIRMALQKLAPALQKGAKFAYQTVKPQSLGEGLLRYGPDILLWPAVSAAMAPQGTDTFGRSLLAAEDAGIGIGASLLGQLVGGGIGRGAIKMGAKKSILPTAITLGDMAAMPLNIVSPRPVMNKVYGQAQLGAEEELRAKIAAEEREKYEALLGTLLTGGGLGLRNLQN